MQLLLEIPIPNRARAQNDGLHLWSSVGDEISTFSRERKRIRGEPAIQQCSADFSQTELLPVQLA